MAPDVVADDRAVSESAGVAILIGFTVLVTASVGIGVLTVPDDGDTAGTTANFSFDYISDNSILLVTHKKGEAIPAGELLIEGPDNSLTWAEIANTNESALVEPGDLVQLSSQSAYGAPVSSADTIRVYHAPDDGNRTVLSTWS